jgi:hypothetical protein
MKVSVTDSAITLAADRSFSGPYAAIYTRRRRAS